MAQEVKGCDEHWWCLEGAQWVCALCGKSEDAQSPDVIGPMESALKLIAAPWPKNIQATTPESEWWRDRCRMMQKWADEALGD